jgi:hypothetical protein
VSGDGYPPLGTAADVLRVSVSLLGNAACPPIPPTLPTVESPSSAPTTPVSPTTAVETLFALMPLLLPLLLLTSGSSSARGDTRNGDLGGCPET